MCAHLQVSSFSPPVNVKRWKNENPQSRPYKLRFGFVASLNYFLLVENHTDDGSHIENDESSHIIHGEKVNSREQDWNRHVEIEVQIIVFHLVSSQSHHPFMP